MNKKDQLEQIKKLLEDAESDKEFFIDIIEDKKSDIEFWEGKLENCHIVIKSLNKDIKDIND